MSDKTQTEAPAEAATQEAEAPATTKNIFLEALGITPKESAPEEADGDATVSKKEMVEPVVAKTATTEETPSVDKAEQKKDQRSSDRWASIVRKDQEATRKLQEAKALLEQTKPLSDIRTLAKENPLEALERLGVSFEDVTRAALLGQKDGTDKELDIVKRKLEQLELSQRQKDEQAVVAREHAALQQIRQDIAQTLDASEEEYVASKYRGTDAVEQVEALILENWRLSGEALDIAEACKMVEDYYRKIDSENMKRDSHRNYLSRLLGQDSSTATTKQADKSPQKPQATGKKTLNSSMTPTSTTQAPLPASATEGDVLKRATSHLRWK